MVNAKLDRRETADLILVLRNAGSALGRTNARLTSRNRSLEIIDEQGEFNPAGAGETTPSEIDRFRVHATEDAPIEVPLYCDLIITGSGYDDTLTLPIIVGDSMNLPVGPDSYGYSIYDWTDSCYSERPEYDWLELRGLGERLIIGDDETRSLELPAGFGVWRYYGIFYRHISICANGWIAADTTSRCDFTNVELPYRNAPPNIVALLWDDLAPSRYGNIWFYYDTTNHRFIVEFDSISYFGMPERWEKVQVQIYDTSQAVLGKDNPIEIHFQTVNDFRSVSVGMQNQNGSAGLTYLYNERYPRSAAPLAPIRSLRIEAGEPTGNKEPVNGKTPRPIFSIIPNPFRNRVRIIFAPESNDGMKVTIYRADGSLIKRLELNPAERNFTWDGRDEAGAMVKSGIYFIMAERRNRITSEKVIHLP